MGLGSLAAVVASLLTVARDVVSKKVSSRVHPFVSSFASFAFAAPFYLLLLGVSWIIGFEDFSWQGSFWFYVFLRAATDTVAEGSRMLAFKDGELSSVSAIFSLHPVITLIFSPLITGDPLNQNIVLGVLLATLGTYFFLKVPKKIPLKSLIFSLLAAVFFSLNNCFDRLSAQSASALFGAFAMNMLAGFFTLPLIFIRPGARQSLDQMQTSKGLFSLRGLFEAVFMTLKLMAVSVLQAPVASAILRLNLILQVFAGRAFFHEEGLLFRVIGSLLIVLGAIVTLI
jgi:uncharacterized membrane protein